MTNAQALRCCMQHELPPVTVKPRVRPFHRACPQPPCCSSAPELDKPARLRQLGPSPSPYAGYMTHGSGDDWLRDAASSQNATGSTRTADGIVWTKSSLSDEECVEIGSFTGDIVVVAAAVTIFCKAFLETLGQRAGESAAKIPKSMRDLIRKHVRRGRGADEYHIGLGKGASAIIVVTEDLPDEARLALLDLDVTAKDVRGKLLRWDPEEAVWCPTESKYPAVKPSDP